MKKYYFLLVAALAVFAVACDNDEKTDDSKQKNFITYGSETANINVGPCGSMSENHVLGQGVEGYHFDSDFTIKDIESHIFLNIAAACKGKKVNLATFNENFPYSFEINSSAEANYPYDIHQYCTEYGGGELAHSSVGTWFKSGTMELKDDGKTLSLDVDATLQDGRAFKMNITTASVKFE